GAVDERTGPAAKTPAAASTTTRAHRRKWKPVILPAPSHVRPAGESGMRGDDGPRHLRPGAARSVRRWKKPWATSERRKKPSHRSVGTRLSEERIVLPLVLHGRHRPVAGRDHGGARQRLENAVGVPEQLRAGEIAAAQRAGEDQIARNQQRA